MSNASISNALVLLLLCALCASTWFMLKGKHYVPYIYGNLMIFAMYKLALLIQYTA